MAFAGGAVENDPGEVEAGLEIPAAGHDGGGGAGHLGGVEDEDDRRVELAGELGRGAGAVHILAVEEAAVALDDGDVRVGGAFPEESGDDGRGQKEGVEVAGRRVGGQGEPRGVDVVGPLLEGPDGEAAANEGAAEPGGDEGLPGAAGESGQDDAGGSGHARPWAWISNEKSLAPQGQGPLVHMRSRCGTSPRPRRACRRRPDRTWRCCRRTRTRGSPR